MTNKPIPHSADIPKTRAVTRADLPLSCPMQDMTLWNAHPRVFLPIEKTGEATCPYCNAHYVLQEQQNS